MIWNRFLTHALRFWMLVPWLLLASIYSFALVGGHRERCEVEIPLIEWFCYTLFLISRYLVYVTLVSPAFFPLFLGLNQSRSRSEEWRVHVGVFTFGWAAIFFLEATDPSGIIAWWND